MSNKNGSKWIRPDKRLAIYLRDDFRCIYCGCDLRGADPRDVTLDHLVCRIDGGSNDESNLCTCCRHCNSQRGDLPVAQYAGPQSLEIIARNTARPLAGFRRLAKALIEDRTGDPSVETR